MYFAILGDCKASKNKNEIEDKEIIEEGIKRVQKLNDKYKTENSENFPLFSFLYRKREWNAKEKCYLGWERKRGLLTQFNEFLMTGENKFLVNTINEFQSKIERKENIKYIITLDSDTNLVLNSAQELVGAMAHILNKPILNDKNIVEKGHAIIEPRIATNLESSNKSLFTKIYVNAIGTSVYENAMSDLYQDNFDEAIFTGKGIYDLEVFYKVLNNEIPENTVLSHDLLEGNYLRCGLATDILLLDEVPNKYSSYLQRNTRWIRGDWQILIWLKNYINNRKKVRKKNPLNRLSKFKILDNLRRSLVPIFAFLRFDFFYNTKT